MRCSILLMVLVVLTAGPALAATMELTVESDPLLRGENSTVRIRYDKVTKSFGAVQFDLVYDSEALEFVSAEQGADLDGAFFESNVREPGRLAISIAKGEGVTGNGTLATLVFKSTGNKESKKTLELQHVSANEFDTGFEIRVTIHNGQWDYEDESDDGNKKCSWTSAALCVGAMVLILLIIVTVIIKKRSKSKAAQ